LIASDSQSVTTTAILLVAAILVAADSQSTSSSARVVLPTDTMSYHPDELIAIAARETIAIEEDPELQIAKLSDIMITH
jgi:hypothetical protein